MSIAGAILVSSNSAFLMLLAKLAKPAPSQPNCRPNLLKLCFPVNILKNPPVLGISFAIFDNADATIVAPVIDITSPK